MSKLKLPDGTYTTDCEKFSSDWMKIRKPFEDIGFKIVGFDPGIAMCDANTNSGTFELPLYAALRIVEAMKVPNNNIIS
jgi:hypothetical protein